ncbi:MAG TPA: anti-sigma factor, partial [Thermoanaerobaculia bacterium]|nr:anti-sigma factor [Thermoanaerobaculia bacterium]
MDASLHSAEIADLLSLYILGALDGEDRRAVEAHLAAGCPQCEAELALLQGDVEALAASLPPVTPSETTRARVLGALPPAEVPFRPSPPIAGPGRRGSGPGRWGWLAAAAVLLLACGWGWLAARREADALRADRGDLSRRVAALGGELAAARARNESLVADVQAARAQNERLATAMAIISAPGMRPIALAALKAPPGAQGYAFVDPRARKAVFVAANLPPLAADRTYELWFIADGKPVA